MIHRIFFDEWVFTTWTLPSVLTAWLAFRICNAHSPTSSLFKSLSFSFLSPVNLKASIPLWRTTKSPRDSNSQLWRPQAELPPFTSSPGKHLTLLVHCHRMGATTRHQCYLLSIQSSNQLCGKEEQLRREAVSWQNKFIKIDFTLNFEFSVQALWKAKWSIYFIHFPFSS